MTERERREKGKRVSLASTVIIGILMIDEYIQLVIIKHCHLMVTRLEVFLFIIIVSDKPIGHCP
jgi:hypothetical protein